ncbi:MAG: succinylglutamate-semialdehyde dehydrogenase [Sphingomonadales bacterium]|nr:succinylglutamate-semialdehyde dehydrogenase [Sphingomonadales bacterium]
MTGGEFASRNPATGEEIWRGPAADATGVDAAVGAARAAFADWSRRPIDDRIAVLERFAALIKDRQDHLAETISMEMGKPLWDAKTEVAAMAGKVAISVAAYHERTGAREAEANGVRTRLVHRPHGVMAVFGPYNFPGHLPNGHIVPALLAGNTVVFKPSEQTPLVAEETLRLWAEAGLPEGVVTLVQGAKDTGIALAGHDGIDGILFTGSVPTGLALHRQLAGRPHKILALEMGGNNPMIACDVADVAAAGLLIAQSAFISSGQRCTCARRLIVIDSSEGGAIVGAVADVAGRMKIGAYTDDPEPFLGPVVSPSAATRVVEAQAGIPIRGAAVLDRGPAFVTPGIVDVTDVTDRPDEEVFGPLLQVIRVRDFDAALAEANNTRFGLAAGLISDDAAKFDAFHAASRAGIVNWNRVLPGASSAAPFGGIGLSGNHRPSAYYAADYCAYPVAGMAAASGKVQADVLPSGIAP